MHNTIPHTLFLKIFVVGIITSVFIAIAIFIIKIIKVKFIGNTVKTGDRKSNSAYGGYHTQYGEYQDQKPAFSFLFATACQALQLS